MVIDQLAYRDWSETMITHPGNTHLNQPEPGYIHQLRHADEVSETI